MAVNKMYCNILWTHPSGPQFENPDKDYYILYTPKSHLTEPEHQHLINVHKQRNGP